MPEQWGGDGLGPDDLAIPECKLIQNSGGAIAKDAGAKPGDFYISLTDEVLPGETGLDLVIVQITKNRTYWGSSDITEEPPVCTSMDARSMRSINEDDCSVCEHRTEAPWLLNRDERRSSCNIGYNIVAINIADGLPLLLRPSGVSAGAAKELYTQLTLNKLVAGAWYKAFTHVTSVGKKTTSGDVFALKFGRLTPIEDPEQYRLQASQMIGAVVEPPEIAAPPAAVEIAERATPEPTSKPKRKKENAEAYQAQGERVGDSQHPAEREEQEIDTNF